VEEEFPRKQFYTIGEVSRITGVKTHVLRYWESQGKLLKPSRRSSRQHRLYRPVDIQLIFEIKRLREEEKLTVAAMRRQMRYQPDQLHRLPPPPSFALDSPESRIKDLLRAIREELLALKELLD